MSFAWPRPSARWVAPQGEGANEKGADDATRALFNKVQPLANTVAVHFDLTVVFNLDIDRHLVVAG